MAEKDNPDKEKFAIFIPVDIEPIENGIRVGWLGIASDQETEEREFLELMDETGASSWSSEEIRSDGSRGKKSFFFSGATWKAPWQPKGPNPNWGEKADPTEPIN